MFSYKKGVGGGQGIRSVSVEHLGNGVQDGGLLG